MGIQSTNPLFPDSDSLALQAVLKISELLEQILLHLPLPDLLIRIPRVSKHFQHFVEASPHLQYRLFLKYSDRCHRHGRPGSDPHILPNPLFYPSEKAYTIFQPTISSSSSTSASISFPFSQKPWKISSPHDIRPLELAELGIPPFDSRTDFDSRSSMQRPGFWFKEASWRRMYAVMPPVKHLVAIRPIDNSTLEFRDEKGVKMNGLGGTALHRVWRSFIVRGDRGVLDFEEEVGRTRMRMQIGGEERVGLVREREREGKVSGKRGEGIGSQELSNEKG